MPQIRALLLHFKVGIRRPCASQHLLPPLPPRPLPRPISLPQVCALLLHFASKVGGEAALCRVVEQQGSPRLVAQLTAVLTGQLDLSDSGDDELLYGPNLLPSRGMSG